MRVVMAVEDLERGRQVVVAVLGSPARKSSRPRPVSANARVPLIGDTSACKGVGEPAPPSITMPVSQCGQAAPPAMVRAVSASSLATAHSSAARRLSCSRSIAMSQARWPSPEYAAALCAHSSA